MTTKRLCGLAAVSITVLAQPAFGQDAANGEDLFKKCRVCHDVGADAKNKIGPRLHGVFGRKAGTVEGFKYSEAMLEAGVKGLEWNEEAVGKYLENPRAFVPGNKMAFPGLKDEADRKDIIAYLLSTTR